MDKESYFLKGSARRTGTKAVMERQKHLQKAAKLSREKKEELYDAHMEEAGDEVIVRAHRMSEYWVDYYSSMKWFAVRLAFFC